MTWCARVLCWIMSVGIVACSGPEPEPQAYATTIRFWHSFVASTVPSLDTLLADFHRAHPNIRVQAQYVPTGDALVQKLATTIRSGTSPDIAWVHADFLDKLVAADAIYSLGQFVEGSRGIPDSAIEDFFPALLEGCRMNGMLYALPMEATSLALLYNRKLFREGGLDPDSPPGDWTELRDCARQLTVDADGDGRIDQFGFLVPVFPASGELNLWMILQWTPFLWQAGGKEMTLDRSRVLFNSPEGVRALTYWKTLYDELEIRRFGLAHDLAFASGKLAMVMDGPWNLPRYRAVRHLDWGVAPLPAGPAGRATYLAGEILVIFKQSGAPAEAWEFLRWVVEPDVQARFSMMSGYLPVRRSVLDLPTYQRYLAEDPAMQGFVKEMYSGRARELPDHHRVELNRLLAQAIEEATLGQGDPKMSLDRAAERANALLSK